MATPVRQFGIGLIAVVSLAVPSRAGTLDIAQATDTCASPVTSIAFTSWRENEWDVYTVDSDGEHTLRLTNHPSRTSRRIAGIFPNPAWSPDGGRIVFSTWRDGYSALYTMRSDGEEQQSVTPAPGFNGQGAWSPDGKSVAFVGREVIHVMDVNGGHLRRLTDHPGSSSRPDWSPDGTLIAYAVGLHDGYHGYDRDIYVMNADGGSQRNITNHLGDDHGHTWSPDSSTIAFSSRRDGSANIYLVDADGSNVRRLTDRPAAAWSMAPAWSPDGRSIAFQSGRQIWVTEAGGQNERQLTHNSHENTAPAWSPDGGSIAYQVKATWFLGDDSIPHNPEPGAEDEPNYEIFVMDADGSNPRNVTRHPGHDRRPVWRPTTR